MSKFTPKLFSTLRTYTKDQFLKDTISGIIVAIIALPLSIALAIASGVSPEVGIYAAIVGGFFVSVLGGSRVQIAGPSAIFMVITFTVISEHGIDGLIIATVMAGIILILLGLFKIGGLVKYVPFPIITGFTSGIAVIIFSSQIDSFFGMELNDVPIEFFHKWDLYLSSFDIINYQSLVVGIISLVILILLPVYTKRTPAALVVIIISSLLVLWLNLDIETVGSKFGEMSSSLPEFSIPKITFDKIQLLIGPALAIAFLGAVESLLTAVVSDGMIGSKHHSNMELVAQGTANIFTGLFGGMPVTGAMARTITNVKNGGRTPIAGIIHSLVLLLIVVSLMFLVSYIPLTTLSAILFVVAYNMVEWQEFITLLKSPKGDVVVLLTTFLLTVFVDVIVALEVGLFLSVFFFIKRMSESSGVHMRDLDFSEGDDDKSYAPLSEQYDLSKAIVMYQINGPFFFGATYKFVETISMLSKDTKVLIIGMEHVPSMDATAINVFKDTIKVLEHTHVSLIITGLNETLHSTLERVGLISIIKEENIIDDVDEAVKLAKQKLL